MDSLSSITNLLGGLDTIAGGVEYPPLTWIVVTLLTAGSLLILGDSLFKGNVTIEKNLLVELDTQIDQDLDVGGNTILTGTLEVHQDITADSDISMTTGDLILAQGQITIQNGNLVMPGGNITLSALTAGNITTTWGNITTTFGTVTGVNGSFTNVNATTAIACEGDIYSLTIGSPVPIPAITCDVLTAGLIVTPAPIAMANIISNTATAAQLYNDVSSTATSILVGKSTVPTNILGNTSIQNYSNLQWSPNTSTLYTSPICRASIIFSDTGSSINIAQSINVTSLIRVTTGIYNMTFTTAMPNANYLFCGNVDIESGLYPGVIIYKAASSSTTIASFNIKNCTSNTSTSNIVYCNILIFF